MENPIKMDDLGVALFLETPILSLDFPEIFGHLTVPGFPGSTLPFGGPGRVTSL